MSCQLYYRHVVSHKFPLPYKVKNHWEDIIKLYVTLRRNAIEMSNQKLREQVLKEIDDIRSMMNPEETGINLIDCLDCGN